MASNSYLDNSGLAYFLTKLASWIPSWFPSQTGQSGKVLTTDGSSLSWTAQSGGEVLDGRISNCLTQIPQDVKLELSGNTLTLKAGSKVYVPNGFEQDGTTKKFTVITTTSDTTQGRWGSVTSTEIFVCCNLSGSIFVGSSSDIVYDPTTNICLQTSTNQCSFPIAMVTFNRGIIVSIDQVFNGFGYIGSTVFVLPNVKGLIPDGRNADGTLKNIPFVCTSVITRELTNTSTEDFAIQEGGSTIRQNSSYVLNEKENLLYTSAGTVEKNCVFARGQTSNGKILSLTPKTTFQAVDINDKKFVRLVEMWRSSDGRLWYRKWSDGWIEQGGYHPSTGNWTDCADGLNTSFNTPFVNAKNTVQITMVGLGDLANPTNVTATKFTLWVGDRLQGMPVTDDFYWYACGY